MVMACPPRQVAEMVLPFTAVTVTPPRPPNLPPPKPPKPPNSLKLPPPRCPPRSDQPNPFGVVTPFWGVLLPLESRVVATLLLADASGATGLVAMLAITA